MSTPAEAKIRSGTKSERTRRRILEAAAGLLAERGYAGTRMVDIGERAELRDASLYYHFPSKDALVEEILRTGVRLTHRNVRAAVRALPATATPVDRLRAAVRAHLESLVAMGDVAAAALRILSQVPAELSVRYRRDQRAYGTLWGELLHAAADAGAIRSDLDLVRVRFFLIGALNWVVEWPRSELRPVAELARVAEAMVLEGLVSPRR